MKKTERAAVEAVAAHFSAPWKESASGVILTLDGKRVPLSVAVVKSQVRAKQRLRFDKVALELLRRMRDGLQDGVPDGRTVVFTVTAPIRQSGKTAAGFAEAIETGLARRAALDIKETIQGNAVRARLVKGGNPKVIGFIHNPDPNSDVLLDLTQALLGQVGALGKKPTRSGRWLVIADTDGRPHIETYRWIASRLSGFKKILIVLKEGVVETLAG